MFIHLSCSFKSLSKSEDKSSYDAKTRIGGGQQHDNQLLINIKDERGLLSQQTPFAILT